MPHNFYRLTEIEFPRIDNLPKRLVVRFQGDKISDVLIDGTSHAQVLNKNFDLALSVYSPGLKYTGQFGIWCLQSSGRVISPRVNGKTLRFLPIDLKHQENRP